MKEIWKDIEDYKGYQVSNLERVRTFNKITYTEKHGYISKKIKCGIYEDKNFKWSLL